MALTRRDFIKLTSSAIASIAFGNRVSFTHASSGSIDDAVKIGGAIPWGYEIPHHPIRGRGFFRVHYLYNPWHPHLYREYPLNPEDHNLADFIHKDGDYYILHLRDGVIGHDESKFNADVVEHSINLKLQQPWYKFLNSMIVDHKKNGEDYAIKLRGDFPLELLLLGGAFPMVPLSVGNEETVWDGFGPYVNKFRDRNMLKELCQSSDGLSQPTFPDYFMDVNNSGLAIRHFEDGEAMMNALRSGELDLTPHGKAFDFNPSDLSFDPESGTYYVQDGNIIVVENRNYVFAYSLIPNTREDRVFNNPDYAVAFYAGISTNEIKKALIDSGVTGALRQPEKYMLAYFDYSEGDDPHDDSMAKEHMPKSMTKVIISYYPNAGNDPQLTILNHLKEHMRKYNFDIEIMERGPLDNPEPDMHLRIGGVFQVSTLYDNLLNFGGIDLSGIIATMTEKNHAMRMQKKLNEELGIYPVIAAIPTHASINISNIADYNPKYLGKMMSAEFLTSIQK